MLLKILLLYKKRLLRTAQSLGDGDFYHGKKNRIGQPHK